MTGEMTGDVARALDDVAGLGPFFCIGTDPAERADPAWRPFTALHREGPRLRALIDAYARRLGTNEDRVAASILFQGLAARLWSPVVAAAAAHGLVPDLAGLHYRWAPGAPMALWLAEPGRVPAAAAVDDHAAAVHRTVMSHLRPLRAAMHAYVRVADGLMWGNAAAAVAGVRAGAAGVRPDLDGRLADLLERVLAREPLAGTGGFVRPFGDRAERFYVRGTCCLYYRVPPGGDYCGDCVLLDPAERLRRWRSALT
jgi:ferric iron reductase protein FhuF